MVKLILFENNCALFLILTFSEKLKHQRRVFHEKFIIYYKDGGVFEKHKI